MNRVFTFLNAIFIIAALSSCQKIIGDGPVVIQERTVANFSGISLEISADVYYTQTPGYQLKISAQQNILNVLESYTSGNVLIIKRRNNVILGRRDRIKIEISSPEILTINQSGSGNFVATDTVRSSSIALTVSGSGSISLPHLLANLMSARVSGSGNITVSGGAVEKANLSISGSGDINTTNLPVKEITTFTSGSGRMRVQALQKLDVSISGSGSVFYSGNPQVSSKISGSGKVVKQ